jgi:hypothetical protein
MMCNRVHFSTPRSMFIYILILRYFEPYYVIIFSNEPIFLIYYYNTTIVVTDPNIWAC